MHQGQCHCGAISYRASGEPMHHALCHCSDCRRHAGAPMVGWAMFKSDQVVIEGAPQIYASSSMAAEVNCRGQAASLSVGILAISSAISRSAIFMS
jgi:hypothetical protein